MPPGPLVSTPGAIGSPPSLIPETFTLLSPPSTDFLAPVGSALPLPPVGGPNGDSPGGASMPPRGAAGGPRGSNEPGGGGGGISGSPSDEGPDNLGPQGPPLGAPVPGPGGLALGLAAGAALAGWRAVRRNR